jgi:hypothetical protein
LKEADEEHEHNLVIGVGYEYLRTTQNDTTKSDNRYEPAKLSPVGAGGIDGAASIAAIINDRDPSTFLSFLCCCQN